MFRGNAKILLLGMLLLGLAAVNAQAQAPQLPESPVREKVETACTECHDSNIIVQQRISKAAWTKELDKMTKWGALVAPTDRDTIIEYLSVNFSPDKPPAIMPRSQALQK
jgi:hypothetical protein